MATVNEIAVYRRAALLGLAYFGLASMMILLTRFGESVATLWLASALLTAELAVTTGKRAWATIAACTIATLAATTLFGFGARAAIPLAVVNIGEAMLVAALLRRSGRGADYLDTLEGFSIFALAIAASTALSALGAATAVASIASTAWLTALREWFAGHALGTLTFAPLLTLLMNGDMRRWARSGRPVDRIEAFLLLSLVAIIACAIFGNGANTLLFVPMLPLIVVSFRLGRPGTVIAIVLLAGIGGVYTLINHGPSAVGAAAESWHVQLFQAYLAVTTLTALPVAAVLKQRRAIFRRLLESEARYKLITESASDVIVSIDSDRVVRYVSPSIFDITGYHPAQLIGLRPEDLISGPDRALVMNAYSSAFEAPSTAFSIEYRAFIASGDLRWFEANIRSIVDDVGNASGWVSTTRDISQRKALEFRLAHAAATDPLTGLANRRRFDALLDRKIDERRKGVSRACIAIFDIDYFKRVNDCHGHAAGDLVLETFAAAALRVLRAGDHVARLGGEEFGLILNGADIEQASRICERLRDTVSRDITRTPNGAEVTITVSAGIAEVTGGTTRLQLMHAADEALYRAKAAGRDRLAIAA